MSVPPASRMASSDFLDAAFAGIFDEEAGGGGDVGLEVGVDAPRIAGRDLDPGVVKTPGEGPAFDKEVNLEARQQYFVERPDDQFILTNGQNAQIRSRQGRGPALRRHPKAEARQTPSIRLLAARLAAACWGGGVRPGRRRSPGPEPARRRAALRRLPAVARASPPGQVRRRCRDRLDRRARARARSAAGRRRRGDLAVPRPRASCAAAARAPVCMSRASRPRTIRRSRPTRHTGRRGRRRTIPIGSAFDLKRALSRARGRHPAATLLIAASPRRRPRRCVSAGCDSYVDGFLPLPADISSSRRTFSCRAPHDLAAAGGPRRRGAARSRPRRRSAGLAAGAGLVPVGRRARSQCGEDRPLRALLNPQTLDLVAVSRVVSRAGGGHLRRARRARRADRRRAGARSSACARAAADRFAEGVDVSAARALTIDEIIARHQAAAARQAAEIVTSIATGSLTLTFEAPGFVAPITITSQTTIYEDSGQGPRPGRAIDRAAAARHPRQRRAVHRARRRAAAADHRARARRRAAAGHHADRTSIATGSPAASR